MSDLYAANMRLSQFEYEQRRLSLNARPRCLGLVLGNACNLRCIHCYQARNADTLLGPPEVAAGLRRELAALYPYISTLRVQGGEVFVIPGFRDLIDDVVRHTQRPILSISTNGTLIDDDWAELLVRTPFAHVTVSIDAATPATFSRIRRGGSLPAILANIDRIRHWKQKLASELPTLDSFFVIMRSNFREIPAYLELMQRHGMIDVALQTMDLSAGNVDRHLDLEADEIIADHTEIRELHTLLQDALPRFRPGFRQLRVSGLQALFEAHHLSTAFLDEGQKSLYPDSDDLAEGDFELCPNPWTTLFITEAGDVHLCFLSRPIGNIYAQPLHEIWNSSQAIAKRCDMIEGRYTGSGCSPRYCAWRDGRAAPAAATSSESHEPLPPWHASQPNGTLGLLRRHLAAGQQKQDELFTLLHAGQDHIHHLEVKAGKAIADFRALESAFDDYRASWLVRAAHKAVRLFSSHF